MQPVSKIVSDISKTAGASVVQLIITLIATPIMTRLYDPEAYAAFGLVFATAGIFIGIGMVSLPFAYLGERGEQHRKELMKWMLVQLMLLTLLALVTAVILRITHVFQVETMAMLMLPVLVMTMGLRQIVIATLTEKANFHTLSVGQMVEPLCSRGGSIALGSLFGGNPAYILLSVAVGNMVAVRVLLRTKIRLASQSFRTVMRRNVSPAQVLRRYANYVVFNTATQQLQPLVLLAIQMAISALFSNAVAGQYVLAVSIITLPVTLIILATAPVIYRHFIEVERTQPKLLLRHLLNSIMLYSVAAVVLLSPFLFFGTELFSFIFGERWAHAGTIASILSVAYMTTIPYLAVQTILSITHRLQLQFYLDATLCSSALIGLIVCFNAMAFDDAIYYLSAAWLIRNIVLLCACIAATMRHKPSVTSGEAIG